MKMHLFLARNSHWTYRSKSYVERKHFAHSLAESGRTSFIFQRNAPLTVALKVCIRVEYIC